jgi:pSer/pThr/pTyr-binding forkhead associated (FHA) protein
VTINPTAPTDELVMPSSLSEGHYTLSLGEEGWAIADTGSLNGLRVNGTYYHQTTLIHGDVIDMGGVRLRFVTA